MTQDALGAGRGGLFGLTLFQQAKEIDLLVGMVAGADQRAAFDNVEAQIERPLLPVGKFFRRHPAIHFLVLLGGLEILADGEDIAVDGTQVAQQLFDFLFLLANAEHDAALGHEAALLGVVEHPQGAVVARGFADRALEALHGLHVVVENVGLGVEDDVQVLGLALKVRRENFHSGVRALVMNGAHGGCPDAGAAVRQVVAGHRGNDDMLEVHLPDAVRDAGWLAEIGFGRATGGNVAEGAGAGAHIAEDHDGCGAAAPALAHIWALGGLAHGVQVVPVHVLTRGHVTGPIGELGAEPIRFAR